MCQGLQSIVIISFQKRYNYFHVKRFVDATLDRQDDFRQIHASYNNIISCVKFCRNLNGSLQMHFPGANFCFSEKKKVNKQN